ncbi:MAG: hypothetical protein JWL69_2594 [Phycisphaerales bacterium]|nr:hypothetical protein [Phycisphaerales bacterium]
MEYESRPPLRQRINFRIIVFFGIIALPFVWLGYWSVQQAMTKGIEHHNGYEQVELKALGNFNFDQAAGTMNDVPKRWRELDGKRVVLEGFMYDGRSAGPKLSAFQFVYNIQKCCFNGPPLVQERVFAYVPHSREVEWVDGFARLTGVLHVNVKKAKDGTITSVYTVEVEKAEPIS